MTNRTVHIGGRTVGRGSPTFIVAEMSGNHHHSLDEALEIVRAAQTAGADAIKLQTYTPDTITLDGTEECFRIPHGSAWGDRTLYDLYREAYTPWEWHPRIKQCAEELGIACFSSPFDGTAVDFLAGLGVPAYKIASFELVDLPLIRRVSATGKPIILSTGLATRQEIEAAVGAARGAGADEIILLKCTSAYPAPPEQMNLRAIPALEAEFDVPVGLSDHTLGLEIPLTAVAVGAVLIEKHLTLSRARGGPDAAFSLEPAEFRDMVAGVRRVEAALGSAEDGIASAEEPNRRFRRSLFVVADVRAGEMLTSLNVRSIRPADGLPPGFYEQVLGRRAARDIARGTPLSWDLLAVD